MKKRGGGHVIPKRLDCKKYRKSNYEMFGTQTDSPQQVE